MHHQNSNPVPKRDAFEKCYNHLSVGVLADRAIREAVLPSTEIVKYSDVTYTILSMVFVLRVRRMW
jgi:hypothetical protein